MADALMDRIKAHRGAPDVYDPPTFDQMADRILELEAENKKLNEQMDAIEEMGTESLNALPDCLMRLAPALVENGELKAKLAKAVDALEAGVICTTKHGGAAEFLRIARTTLAELKGQDDE